jgi:very-short-patch-repair endonuclease
VGPYILDFYCAEKRIGIELDGFQHLENKDYDKERDNYLLMNDIKILRFWNSEISGNIDEVLNKIKKELLAKPHPNVGGGLVGV